MNKIDSLDFLQACIEQLNCANETELQKMKQVYKDEKTRWKDYFDEIEIVLPEYDVSLEPQKTALDKIVVNNVEKEKLTYSTNDFYESSYNEFEEFAA